MACLTLLLAMGACRRAPPTAPAPTAIARVDFAGCDAIVTGPVCELGDERTVRAWFPSGDAFGGATADGGALVARTTPAEGGTRVEIDVPIGARSLVLAFRRGTTDATWTLRLAEAAPLASAVAEARAMRRAGKPDDAARQLSAALPSLAGKDAAIAVGIVARIDLARGDIAAARRGLDDAIARHAALGRASDASDDASVLAYALIRDRRFADAREAIAREWKHSDDYAEGRAIARYNEGLLAQETADARAALRGLGDAERESARIGYDEQRRVAILTRALLFARIGRARDAVTLLADLERTEGAAMPSCSRADVLVNLGWCSVVASGLEPEDLALPPVPDARPTLEAARSLYHSSCPSSRDEANAMSSIAWADLDRGDPVSARAHLDEAKRLLSTPDANLRVHWLHIEGRLALAMQKPKDALSAFERMARAAAAAGSPEEEWRAAEGRAEALAAVGKTNEALDVATAADASLDEVSRLVPLGEGRGSFLGAREQSVRMRVELLLERGRVAEALDVARRSRARVVADLQRSERLSQLDAPTRARWEDALGAYRRERDALAEEASRDWGLSAKRLDEVLAARRERERRLRATLDEALSSTPLAARPEAPRAPSSGELLLAYHPLRRGWVGFAVLDGAIASTRFAEVDRAATPAALAKTLLEPFAASIRAATRVRVLAYGALRAIDFHALPHDGAPLVAHAPVAYGLDVPGDGGADNGQGGVVIADPTDDLPSTRAEAETVRDALANTPNAAVVFSGPEATLPRATSALATATLFHYAGHGVFGGRDGWESALPLAAGATLSVGDILALARVPPLVVLSGCETARTDRASRAEGLGLAQAFLASGTHAVIAATRVVDDAATAKLMHAMYKSPAMARGDLAAALRDAQLEVARDAPTLDGSAFRALRR